MRDFNKVPPRFDASKGNQKRQVALAFYSSPKTRTMVQYETGVPIKNIDRIIAEMLKTGTLFVVKKGVCEITNMPGVIFYSDNEKYYPKNLPIQLKLYKSAKSDKGA